MALFIRQEDNRSELQEKVAADLRQRMTSTSQQSNDHVGSGITENSKESTNKSFLWGAIFAVAFFIFIVFALFVF